VDGQLRLSLKRLRVVILLWLGGRLDLEAR
jgi:hypothetical protein